MKKLTINAVKQMCTSCRDGRRRRRHHPPHLIRKLINFCCNLLEKNLHQLSGFPSPQLVHKSRLGWSPSCRWRRLFSIVYITQHPPPLIHHYHQPSHLLHSTIVYTIKYSMKWATPSRQYGNCCSIFPKFWPIFAHSHIQKT